MKQLIKLLLIASIVIAFIGCGSNGASNENAFKGVWAWVSGSNSINEAGNYGTISVSSTSNVPGARDSALSWSDSNGNLWLFGGHYYDPTSHSIFFNDLWKFDGSNWTWVKGSSTGNQVGNYGTKGV